MIFVEAEASPTSDPDVVLGRPLACLVASVQDPARLEKEELDLRLSEGLVLGSLGHHEHLARPQRDGTVGRDGWKAVDRERSVEHRRQRLGREAPAPSVRVQGEAHLREALEPGPADDTAVVLDDEILALPGAGWPWSLRATRG